jgi:outer membrane protein TolC
MRWHGRRLPLLLLAVLGAAEPAALRAAPAKPAGKAVKSAGKPVPAKVEAARVEALMLEEVLKSVMTRYPPWLAALIEQDIAGGRLRQTLGAFDPSLSAKLGTQGGYYDADYADAGVEQALPFWGGSLYGGYRLSSGLLPDYSKDRTQEDGELRFGGRLNLLRDGAIDRRRAAVFQARLDEELADPFILRQYLDFIRAATRAYVNWLASGLRLKVSEEILRVARERDGAIGKQIEEGLSAPIVRTDNEQLVLSRSLEVVRAQRRLEAAAIELSLFLRDAEGRPVLAGRERLPEAFPVAGPVPAALGGVELLNASVRRPELRRFDLMMEKVSVDERLARNNLLPNLDLGLSAAREFGGGPYKDLERTELQAGIELKVPLGRNEAKGRLEVAAAQMDRLRQEALFARDRIVAEVQDAFSAMEAAMAQISQNRRNVELAVKLEEAERFRFQEGASDLLALQIREQRTFEAKLSEVEAVADYFRALAEYRAAVAADAPLPGRTAPIPPAESKPIPVSGGSRARR